MKRAILQTRPQGERSAVENLARRAVPAISPTETVTVRRRRGSKTITEERQEKLLPGYIVASPESAHGLEAALSDMAVREPRRDVQRVVGFASDGALHAILSRHGGVKDETPPQVRPGSLARITAGLYKGFTARVDEIQHGRCLCLMAGARLNVSLDDVEAVEFHMKHESLL